MAAQMSSVDSLGGASCQAHEFWKWSRHPGFPFPDCDAFAGIIGTSPHEDESVPMLDYFLTPVSVQGATFDNNSIWYLTFQNATLEKGRTPGKERPASSLKRGASSSQVRVPTLCRALLPRRGARPGHRLPPRELAASHQPDGIVTSAQAHCSSGLQP